jgi:hypothetical protein
VIQFLSNWWGHCVPYIVTKAHQASVGKLIQLILTLESNQWEKNPSSPLFFHLWFRFWPYSDQIKITNVQHTHCWSLISQATLLLNMYCNTNHQKVQRTRSLVVVQTASHNHPPRGLPYSDWADRNELRFTWNEKWFKIFWFLSVETWYKGIFQDSCLTHHQDCSDKSVDWFY